MGLDYAYRLFFPRERVPEALEGLAALCAPPPRRTAFIHLPQGIREFPFEPFREDAPPNWDDESYSFDIILRLAADEALEKFTHIAPQQLEEQGREVHLGYVYFRVDNPPEEAVSRLVFIAGGNRMTLLSCNWKGPMMNFLPGAGRALPRAPGTPGFVPANQRAA
jgi:hypothetical protein